MGLARMSGNVIRIFTIGFASGLLIEALISFSGYSTIPQNNIISF